MDEDDKKNWKEIKGLLWLFGFLAIIMLGSRALDWISGLT